MGTENTNLNFYSIKKDNGQYEGMFIAETEDQAREIAEKNGFQIDENTIFENVTKQMTPADKMKNNVITGE